MAKRRTSPVSGRRSRASRTAFPSWSLVTRLRESEVARERGREVARGRGGEGARSRESERARERGGERGQVQKRFGVRLYASIRKALLPASQTSKSGTGFPLLHLSCP